MVFRLGDITRDFKVLVQCKEDSLSFLENNIDNKFKDYPNYKEILEKLEFID